jgi:hypothetical protein
MKKWTLSTTHLLLLLLSRGIPRIRHLQHLSKRKKVCQYLLSEAGQTMYFLGTSPEKSNIACIDFNQKVAACSIQVRKQKKPS